MVVWNSVWANDHDTMSFERACERELLYLIGLDDLSMKEGSLFCFVL
jgi:hypothetical protein